MYEYITGQVAEATPTYAVIEAAGVGYFIHISLKTYSDIEASQQARLYTHFIVREDQQTLFGFSTKLERELFRQVVTNAEDRRAPIRAHIRDLILPLEKVLILVFENACMSYLHRSACDRIMLVVRLQAHKPAAPALFRTRYVNDDHLFPRFPLDRSAARRRDAADRA